MRHPQHPNARPHQRVLVIGASGYLGHVVTGRLLDEGHAVVALVRPTDGSHALDSRVDTVEGDLRDPASVRAAVTPDVDAVVHLATPLGDEAADAAALEALLSPLRDTGRTLLYTSGAWVLGALEGEADLLDEDSPTRPLPLVGYRHRLEEQVLAAAAEGVRGLVIRPGVAHGRGGGIPALLVDRAREDGAGRHVGEGLVRWPMVHVDDLADLFVMALRSAPAGSVLHGVAEEGVDTREIAAAAATAAGVSGTRAWPLAEAAAVLGEPFAEALACDQRVSAERTRRCLGWRPHRPTVVADLERGSYGTRSAA